MKLLFAIIIMVSLSSCFTQMNITKSKEPISETALRKMKPGKNYTFHFKDEYIYKVQIENITDSTVTGKTKSVYHKHIWRGEVPAKDKLMDEKEKEPFVYGYAEIEEKTTKITTRKFNPYMTAIPVGFLVVSVVLIVIVDPFGG